MRVRTALLALGFALLPWIALAFAPAVPLVPNPRLTPGATDPAVTQATIAQTICVSGYTARVRKVGSAEKREVFAEYQIDPKSDHFEVDHLISLEIGGSNDIRNLWPQSYTTRPWNAHVKDRLENRLRRLVCSHALTLEDAQRAIVTDWEAAYVRYVRATVATR